MILVHFTRGIARATYSPATQPPESPKRPSGGGMVYNYRTCLETIPDNMIQCELKNGTHLSTLPVHTKSTSGLFLRPYHESYPLGRSDMTPCTRLKSCHRQSLSRNHGYPLSDLPRKHSRRIRTRRLVQELHLSTYGSWMDDVGGDQPSHLAYTRLQPSSPVTEAERPLFLVPEHTDQPLRYHSVSSSAH